MYFSMITPEEGSVRDAMHQWAKSGCYAEHQWLWKFFPAPEGTPRDFLFRRRDAQGVPRFYVVSRRPPQEQGYAWSVQTRDYAPVIERGDRFLFDLRANPVVTLSKDGKSARHDVVMHEKTRLLEERGLQHWSQWHDIDKPELADLIQRTCGAWLARRAANCGFEIDEDCLVAEGYAQHESEPRPLRLSTIDFSGRLKVTDPEVFHKSLINGIGHAKAFGCGLLLIRRA